VRVLLDGNNAATISMGDVSACALSSDASVIQCWGNNDAGELGNGTTVSSATPQSVVCPEDTLACTGLQPVLCRKGVWVNNSDACSTVVGGLTAAEAKATCTAGACIGVCEAGKSQCLGSAIQICGADGQWGAPVACPDAAPTCAASACIGTLCGRVPAYCER
jgi:hypothetical protein